MGKCKRQVPRRRISVKAHSNLSNYKHQYKGHAWEGHGEKRRCKLCGYIPCKYRPGIDKHDRPTSYANGIHYDKEPSGERQK